VAVKVQRDSDFAVTEAFARDLRMNTVRQHVGRVSMPQVVKASPEQGGAAE
jgi:hypothetical protein